MAIFVANLAYVDETHIAMAKAAILSASTVAGIIGFTFLLIEAKADAKRGVLYVTSPEGADSATFADAEARRASEGIIDTFGEEDQAEVQEAFEDRDNREVAVQLNPEELKKG